MHERALISRTAREVISLAAGHPVFQVTLARSPETPQGVVEDAWHSATMGTSVADAHLICILRDHGLQCLDCGTEFRGSKLSVCPVCGGNGLIVEPAPEVALEAWSTGGNL